MILKKISLLALVLITNISCSQKNNNKMENLNKIYEKVLTYNVKPEYWLFLHTSNCSYIITLDDMPIYTAYNDNSMKSLSIPLNNFILESKKHEIKVLILPKVDENYNLNKVLGNELSFDLKITRVENKKEDSEKLISEINKDVNKEQNLTLENYKLVFYANGKVVGLIRTDGEFFGKSAFLGLTDEDFYIYSLLLHRPKLSSSLEVIR